MLKAYSQYSDYNFFKLVIKILALPRGIGIVGRVLGAVGAGAAGCDGAAAGCGGADGVGAGGVAFPEAGGDFLTRV